MLDVTCETTLSFRASPVKTAVVLVGDFLGSFVFLNIGGGGRSAAIGVLAFDPLVSIVFRTFVLN